MKGKTENQVFVTTDMIQHYFPHAAKDDSWIIVDGASFDDNGDFVPLDLSSKKIVNGELVFKTGEDLAAEELVKCDALKTQYEAERMAALSSPELTIFHDSTLSQVDKDKINAVRQEWYAMTDQPNYPLDFIRPSL